MMTLISKTSTNNDFRYYHESHPYESDIAIIDAGTSFFIHFLRHLFVKTGLRKMAKIKEINNQDYELFVQCPYCSGITCQKKISRKYQCKYCKKKSYIMIGPAGLFMSIATKRINNPQIDNISDDKFNRTRPNSL